MTNIHIHNQLFIAVILLLLIFGQHDAQAFSAPPLRCISYNRKGCYQQRQTTYNNIHRHSTKIDTQDEVTIEIENDATASLVVDTQLMPSTITDLENDNDITIANDDDVTTPRENVEDAYKRGLLTIGFITLLFASNSPAVHSAFRLTTSTPPVLLINALVTVVGLLGVVALSPFLGKIIPDPSSDNNAKKLDGGSVDTLAEKANDITNNVSFNNILTRIVGPSTIAGVELGLWKTLGTTSNIYGLSQTSSDHGAFLIQLTTLIVPVAQGLSGVPIPTRIWTAIGLALSGVFMFTQDPSQSDCASPHGDLLCALAAIFYATYDLRLFKWGKLVPTDELITTKMVTQSLLSFGLLAVLARQETLDFLTGASSHDLELVGLVSLWSGLAVNCLAPYLQVSGQQAVGPARAQILYASQPLWAAIMSFFILQEAFGLEGIIGGGAFLAAMALAATAEMPDPNCPVVEEDLCEV